MACVGASNWRCPIPEQLIAVPHGLLKQVQKALDTAADSIVTIAGLCRIGVDFCENDARTMFNAIDACMSLQQHFVWSASGELDKFMDGIGDRVGQAVGI